MKNFVISILVFFRRTLASIGLLVLLAAAALFSNWPWRAYKSLSAFPNPSHNKPDVLLLMGGSGIPGKSALMRTYYAAAAASLHPDASILVAMPLDAPASEAARAYLDELKLRGVPSDRASILPGGRNTREQALQLAARLGPDASSATVLVVTDPSHVRRTAGALRRAGIPNVAAMPAYDFSIEDSVPPPLRAEPEAASCSALPPEAQAVVAPAPEPNPEPMMGRFQILRYAFWTNLGYATESLREYAAIFAYWSRGWL